jgi:tape measure domain-containing protein
MDKELRIKIKIDSKSQELVLMKQQVQDLGKGFDNASSLASTYTNKILALGGAYLSLNAAINGGKSFIHQADAMHLLDARLKLATTSTAEYESQQKKLLKVSLDSYTSLSDTTTLFTKLNPALQKVGANTDQVNTMVSTFTKGLQLGGASAEESSSSILQFSQAMGSGVLRGEEFNAMAEASPKLMEYLAKGLGVPQTALRKMAEEGELTSVRVTNALLAVKTDIERDFLTMPVTVGKAMTNMSTNMSLAIKEIDEATGASTLLSNTIIDFTRNISDGSESIISFYEGSTNFINEHNQALNTTGTIVKTVAAAYLGFAVTSGIATGIGAITTSVYALRTSILVLQTSIPIIGWVAAAVGTAAGAYVLANDMMDESNYKSEISTDRLKEKIKELEDRKASLAQNKFKDSNEKTINLEIEALQSKLKLQEQLTKKQIQSTTNIIPTAEKTAVTELIGEYEGYAQTIDKITEKKKTFSELTKELQKEIDPVRAIKEEYEALRKSIKGTEADTPEYNKKINENELEAIEKLDKEKISKAKETAKRISEIESEFSLVGLNTWDSKFKELDNKYNADLVKYKDIIGAKEKLDSIYADKINELANQRNNEIQKEDLSYYERLVQLKSDSLEKEIELANISYSQKTLDIQDLNRPIAEKEKLISLETELYNKTIERLRLDDQANKLDEVSTSYQDMLDAQISLIDATNDWNSNLTGTAASLADIASATTNLSKLNLTSLKNEDKLRTEYEKNKLKFYDNEEKLKELDIKYTKDKGTLDEKNLSSTLIGFSNISAAVSTLFDQGSKEAAVSQIAQSSLALVEGTRAILTAGTGDPYTAIPRMISMAAMVSSLFSNIGIAFGMNTTSTYSDAFSSMEANTGTGSVLGDTTAQSESIKNSLSILQDFAQPQYLILNEMNSYVKSIESKIGGISSLLIQNTGYALGKGYEGFDTGYSNTYSLNNDIATAVFSGGAGLLLSKLNIPILSDITGLFGNVVNSVLGGLFGKTSVSQSLKDSGIYFADALLTSAIEQFDGDAYQTIKTTVSKKSWFSKSSSTTIKSYFKDLDEETNKQFSLVLDSLFNTVLTAGVALDNSEENTANSLANFVVSIGKISLKDKTGTEIQEELNSVFGKVGDDIAKTAFPALNDFQQIGEGMFETLTRVATGMEEADYYIGRLGNRFDDVIYTAIGNKQGTVGFEALLQSIEKVELATYPTNNGLLNIIENLSGTAEELYSVYINLDELRDRLVFLGLDSQGLSSTMIYGAGTITDLQSGFKSYFENFLSDDEQLAYKTEQLTEKFNDLGLALPNSNIGFKDLLLSIDETTASGQELFGRLIILSEEFAQVSSLRVDALQEELDITNGTISNIKEISTSLDNVITSLRSGLDSSSTNLLEKFNKSMSTSLLLSATDDYTALANSVKDTINYSSALNNSDYFGSLKEMQYAQAVAANKFEGININIEDELSVLQEIASNTKNMITALSNLTTSVNALKESSEQTASNTAESRYVS